MINCYAGCPTDIPFPSLNFCNIVNRKKSHSGNANMTKGVCFLCQKILPSPQNVGLGGWGKYNLHGNLHH